MVENVKVKKKKKRDKGGAVGSKEAIECTEGDEKSVAAPGLGQWATADLGDTRRQNKFYKLLGGFKSESVDVSKTQPSKPFAAKFNAALDRKQEFDLHGKLEKQFDDARNARLNTRGFGLGFSAPKKNSIDISVSRSKKFDD